MDKIVYWKKDLDGSITFDTRQEIDLASAISETERMWQQKITLITFEKTKPIEHKFESNSKTVYEYLGFTKLEGKWFAELKVADHKIPNGLRYLWKSVYSKKMMTKIIQAFFGDNPAVGLKWSRRYTKSTREMDRQSILWYIKNCNLDTKYDFSEIEYMRIRNFAIKKNVNQELIEKLDCHYDSSYWGTSRQSSQDGSNYSSGAYMGWGCEIRNYIHLASLVENLTAEEQGITYKPAASGSLFFNSHFRKPTQSIRRLKL